MATSRPAANTDEFQDPLENYAPKVYADPLERALAEETVASIQHQPVATVSSATPVAAAVSRLAHLHVACLLVEDQGQLVGVFTDRDVLDRVALEYDAVKELPVCDLMTPNPVVIYEADSAAAALSVMAVCGLRHVPITDVAGQALGIVSPQRVTAFLRKHLNQ